MTHLDEETLLDAYYGPVPVHTSRHLACCSACRDEFERMQDLLDSIRAAAQPEPPPGFENRIWHSLESHMLRSRWPFLGRWRLATAALVFCSSLVLIFALRPVSRDGHPTESGVGSPQPQSAALSRHLERAQILITEVLHGSSDENDFRLEQKRASELLLENRRLHNRVTAQNARLDQKVLDDVGLLLERIAASPSRPDAASLRAELDDDGLLFKVRVTRASLERHF